MGSELVGPNPCCLAIRVEIEQRCVISTEYYIDFSFIKVIL